LQNIQHKIQQLSKHNQQAVQNAVTVAHGGDLSSNGTESSLVGSPLIGTLLHTTSNEILHSEFRKSSDLECNTEKGPSSTTGDVEEETAFVVEVDDEIDEDTMVLLLEPPLPPGFSFCNTEILPGSQPLVSNVQLLTAIRRVEWSVASRRLNQQFSAIFYNLYSSIIFKLRALTPCCICALNVDIQLPDDKELQIILTAMVALEAPEKPNSDKKEDTNTDLHDLQFPMDHSFPKKKTTHQEENRNFPPIVQLTPMSFVPGAQLSQYVGRINLHFIKESFTIREQGGLGGFNHIFLNEVNAIVRSHVASLGGNTLLGYRIDECSIMENASKNQSYSLISISGDAVTLTKS